MKKIFLTLAVAGIFTAGFPTRQQVRAAEKEPLAPPTVLRGTSAKMVIFDNIGNCNDVLLTPNNRYFLCRAGGTLVYDIERDSSAMMDEYLIGYTSPNTYLTGEYGMIDGTRCDAFAGLAGRYDEWSLQGTSIDCHRAMALTMDNRSIFDEVVFDVVTGEIVKEVPHIYPDDIENGYGSRVMGFSNDMNLLVGSTSTRWALTNFSPAVWDLGKNQWYYLGNQANRDMADGTLYACNNNGTLITGDIIDRAWAIFYDREARSFTKEAIPIENGFNMAYGNAVSETGMIVVIEQKNTEDRYGRRSYLYNAHTKVKYSLKEYLQDLYGLDAEERMPLFTPMYISDDAQIIAGHSYINEVWTPYVIVLDGPQLHAPAREMAARQIFGSANISLTWKAPLMEQYTVSGYNIYRDSVRVNPETLPSSTLTFTDHAVEEGMHYYYVEAVYTDGQATACQRQELRVVKPGGCLPVQRLTADLRYNKTATLRWGLPSAETYKPVASPGPASYAVNVAGEGELDIIDFFSTGYQSICAAVRIGRYYYAAHFNSSGIYLYDVYTKRLDTAITINQMMTVQDLSVHNHTIYAVSGNNKVWELSVNPDNPYDISVSSSWSSRFEKASHIAYVENAEGDDFLIVGDWYHLGYYPLNPMSAFDTLPVPVKYELEGLSISGSEAHGGLLYLGDQNGEHATDIVVLDMATGKRLSRTDLYGVSEDLFHASINDYGYMGGLSKTVADDGTTALVCLVQPYYQNGQLVSVEIEPAPQTVGYNIYRNGTRLNAQPLKVRHYSEDLNEAGTYEYVIEYVSTDCNSRSDEVNVKAEVKVTEKGNCQAPGHLSVFEAEAMAHLNWDFDLNDNKFRIVGFNVYRNGQMLANEMLDLKYQDPDVVKGEKYLYKVESFFENACTAADSVEITITHEGVPLSPTLVQFTPMQDNERGLHTRGTWDLPYYEPARIMSYCNLPAGSIGVENTEKIYQIIGWNGSLIDEMDEDLYLVGMEFFLAFEPKGINALIYVDDRLVYNQPLRSRMRVEEWNTVYFDRTYPMKQKQEIAVGYSVNYASDDYARTLPYDLGPNNFPGRSDLYSTDGRNYAALSASGLNANLCIRALVARKRDLPPALQPDEAKISSQSHTLIGFNVYRDGEKINGEPLAVFDYYDRNVKADQEYEYTVSAVYAEGDEVESEPVFVNFNRLDVEETASKDRTDITVYPNPTSGTFHVCLPFEAKAEIITADSRILSRRLVHTDENTFTLNRAGLYFIRITAPECQPYVKRIIVR